MTATKPDCSTPCPTSILSPYPTRHDKSFLEREQQNNSGQSPQINSSMDEWDECIDEWIGVAENCVAKERNGRPVVQNLHFP
jgi:hypothetical protein